MGTAVQAQTERSYFWKRLIQEYKHSVYWNMSMFTFVPSTHVLGMELEVVTRSASSAKGLLRPVGP